MHHVSSRCDVLQRSTNRVSATERPYRAQEERLRRWLSFIKFPTDDFVWVGESPSGQPHPFTEELLAFAAGRFASAFAASGVRPA